MQHDAVNQGPDSTGPLESVPPKGAGVRTSVRDSDSGW
jgi:hypothetical protein